MNETIKINDYLEFDKEDGKFILSNLASEIIYRQKQIICSYSGANEWCNHFVCQLLDIYSGSSIYNYCIDLFEHERAIPEHFMLDKESVFEWIEKTKNEDWSKKVYKLFENIICDLPRYD